jgi:hypothetical protein
MSLADAMDSVNPFRFNGGRSDWALNRYGGKKINSDHVFGKLKKFSSE